MSGLSVVIPCRNGDAWLAQTIRSALNQDRPPDEIIVVDDGSTDQSGAIAAGFGPPVRVEAGQAKGAAAARNRGAELAAGDKVMFLDADDLLTPPTLAALAGALEAVAEPAVALCPWDRYEREGEAWIAHQATAALPRPGQDRLAAWLTGTWSPPAAILWDRAAYDRSGGWLPMAGLDDDGNLLRRALARGVPAVWAPGGLALYRRLPDGAASFSSRRLEPVGLRARQASLADTLSELPAAGRYRAALVEALTELAADARHDDEIAREVQALIGRAGGRRPLDGVAARLGRLGARGAAWLDERRRPRTTLAGGALAGGALVAPVVAPAEARAAQDEDMLVSVVMPTYNRPEQTLRAAESVLAQTHRRLELLVVDDGSTDDTAARVGAVGDPRLRLLRQRNAGVAAARNRGLADAGGDLIALLDSDDVWRPEKLALQVGALARAPAAVGLCCTGFETLLADGTSAATTPAAGRLADAMLLRNCLEGANSTLMMRREVYEAVGGFDPSLPAIEDWEWLQRATRLYDVTVVNAPLMVYDDQVEDDTARRSRNFRSNMSARDMLWRRNRHALRRIGAADFYLIESARRELRETGGSARRGGIQVLRALAERPQARAIWPWLGYMLAPSAVRAQLRRIDGALGGPTSGRLKCYRAPKGDA